MDALRKRLDTKLSGIKSKFDKAYGAASAKRETASKHALDALRTSEQEAEQKYQDKLRQHDLREERARKQEEASVARATDALEKAVRLAH